MPKRNKYTSSLGIFFIINVFWCYLFCAISASIWADFCWKLVVPLQGPRVYFHFGRSLVPSTLSAINNPDVLIQRTALMIFWGDNVMPLYTSYLHTSSHFFCIKVKSQAWIKDSKIDSVDFLIFVKRFIQFIKINFPSFLGRQHQQALYASARGTPNGYYQIR